MKIGDLRDGMSVRCRFGRAGKYRVEWGDWEVCSLFVQVRTHDLPKRLRKRLFGSGKEYWHAGDPTVIAVRNKNWAEYRPSDLQSDGILVCEDYYLDIEGLES